MKDRRAIQPVQVLHSLLIKTPVTSLDDLGKSIQPTLEGATSLLCGKTDDADRQDAVVSLLHPLIDHDDSVQLLTIDGQRDATPRDMIKDMLTTHTDSFVNRPNYAPLGQFSSKVTDTRLTDQPVPHVTQALSGADESEPRNRDVHGITDGRKRPSCIKIP